MSCRRTRRRAVALVATAAAVAVHVHPAFAINITMNFTAATSTNPAFDPTGAGLQSIMNHIRGVYNDIFEDAHNITLNYRWDNTVGGSTLAVHNLTSQGGSPNRETAGTIRFNTNFTWFIDPTPADNSEYNMQQTLWRDITATQRTNWYNAGANIPDTFEVGFTGPAFAGAPANAINGTDLLSVAFHEVGHALGMSAANTATQAQTADGDYDFNSSFVFGRTLAARIAAGNNIAHLAGGNAIMFPSFGTGQRKLPSHTDLFSMASGHQYTLLDVPRREFYGGSDWNTAGNWSGNTVPGSADDTFVRNPGSLITMGLSANGFCADLLVSEGAWVSTNTNTLFVFGRATIDRAGAGASTQLRVNSGGTLSATQVLATNGGTLTMLGGFASVGTLTTTNSGGLSGQGTVSISGQLINSGTITASGGTLTLNTTGSGALNLDGIAPLFGAETGVVSATGGSIIVNGPLTDVFNGAINVSAGNRINFNNAWTLAAGSGTIIFSPAGRLNLNGGTNAASAAILGGTGAATLNGVINVTGQGSIAANATLNTPNVTVAAGGTLLFGNATFNGGSYTGAGRIGFDGNTIIASDTTIAVNTFDFDGDFLNDTFTINTGATLTVNSPTLADPFDEFLVVNGTLLMNTTNGQWTNNGTTTMNTGTIGGSAPLRMNGRLNVNSGVSRITSDATFTTNADLVLNAGSTLNLEGDVFFLGGSYTGSGTLGFDGNQTVVNSTTFSVNTLNWDGFNPIGSFTVSSGAVATFNVSAIETAGDQYDGTTTLNSGTLVVNTPSSYTFAGTLNLNNTGGGTPRLAGQTVKMQGVINSSGSTQITAPIQNQGFTVNSTSGVLLTNGGITSPGASSMVKNGPAAWTISGAQSHAAGSSLNVNAGTVTMTTNAGAGGQNLTVNVNGGTVSFNTTNRIAALNIGPGARANVPGTGNVVNTRSLAIDGGNAPTGRVNLAGNAMVIDYTAASPVNTVRAQVASGYNGGAWTGEGIITSFGNASTHGVGYAESSAIFGAFPANFLGESVDNTAVLMRYTRYGDANLDGLVNLADFNRLAANFGSGNAFWWQGDFNYDGLVNLADFNRLAANFGLAATGADTPTPEDWAALAAVVPEPGMLSLAGLGAVALMRRRRR